ncbi:phytochrome A-associated F-box protein-like [Setaria italica]|uniref:phytochrome A-associated F-box protein-like n=1 Tax=Setaria italica TaxID=4555 RepID=UPI000350A25A|nr:phytochrome A-associated F-box protein-like [Setaria italica]
MHQHGIRAQALYRVNVSSSCSRTRASSSHLRGISRASTPPIAPPTHPWASTGRRRKAPASWAALHKLSVCCPRLLRVGVLLEPTGDFGLKLDIGPDVPIRALDGDSIAAAFVEGLEATATSRNRTADIAADAVAQGGAGNSTDAAWSLYDDMYLDVACDCSSEPQIPPAVAAPDPGTPPAGPTIRDAKEEEEAAATDASCSVARCGVVAGSRRHPRRWLGTVGAHLASGSWTLSREQRNKLLASRFRGDQLCDWLGCVHAEECRKYMAFRGDVQR